MGHSGTFVVPRRRDDMAHASHGARLASVSVDTITSCDLRPTIDVSYTRETGAQTRARHGDASTGLWRALATLTLSRAKAAVGEARARPPNRPPRRLTY